MEQKIELTREVIERIRNDLASVPTTPVGHHLSDDDFIAYSMEQVSGEDKKRIDAHLESCEDCLVTMEDLLEANLEWNSEEGKQRIEQQKTALIDAIKNKESFSEALSDVHNKVIEIILDAKDKISFKGFKGFAGGFQQEGLRAAIALGDRDDSAKKISAYNSQGNNDYHIDVIAREKEIAVFLHTKGLKTGGIIITIYDDSENIVGKATTDTDGKATINI